MSIFEDVYMRLVVAAKNKRIKPEIENLYSKGCDKTQLDCLLYPERHAPIVKWGKCNCEINKDCSCVSSCKFNALNINKSGDIEIKRDKCVGCAECEQVCKNKKFKINKEIIPVINLLNSQKEVYSIVAPAFVGQFSPDISSAKLRGAFRKLGFKGMIEVALFADILTLKEALEFDKNINKESDFQLTSCCCPIWISMIKKYYSELMLHVPASVSPMIACARSIKKLRPHAKVIFIGPCIAKKAEAREADLIGAVDYVLTFKEVKELFEIMEVDLSQCEEIERNHSSYSGRIYARSGGVSEAVSNTLKRIGKNSNIQLLSKKADGVCECKQMLNELIVGKTKGNFFEGMGCKGGCVGGPRSIVDVDKGIKNVSLYAGQALYETPVDNPYVLEVLNKLGFDTIESLLNPDSLFARKFT